MRQSIFCSIISVILVLGLQVPINSQNVEGADALAGDHFSLEGALELFKKSKSPEDFEKKLNIEDSKVNNLDLNEDGKIDYIRVTDHMDGDVHAIVLSVPLSEKESQDIAVIEIEKREKDDAILQIIGDEDVYGELVIVEPFHEDKTQDKGGPEGDYSPIRLTVNVISWPCVVHVYRPGYVLWVSPWRYQYYPRWWTPWKPLKYNVWRPYRSRYKTNYHVVTTHRVVRAHKVYVPKRRTTTVVATKTKITKTKRVTTSSGSTITKSKTSTTIAGKKTDGKKVVGSKSERSVSAKSVEGQKAIAKKEKSSVVAHTAEGRKVSSSKTAKKVSKTASKTKAGTKKTAGKTKVTKDKTVTKKTTKKVKKKKKG